MGFKLKFKKWISKKLKNLLTEEPTLIKSNEDIQVGIESYHNGNFEIRGKGQKVSIGSYCAIGKDVKLILSNHSVDYPSMQYSFYKNNFKKAPFKKEIGIVSINIGSDVWIGDNVIILPNVSVGHGAVIGAGSIISKNVEPYNIVAGIPARKIKSRFDSKTIERLLELKWWEWDKNKILENESFFFKKMNNNGS